MLGAKCLVGLALHKAGRTDSPRIGEAVRACRDQASAMAQEGTTYSPALAVVFLSEVAPKAERALINQYLDALLARQKQNGGWGYPGEESGDTSQTQYVALALWQAHRAGVRLPPERPRGMIDWLNRTQGPDGGWGYKGTVSPGSELVQQYAVSPTLTAAALASLMIGADLHGLLNEGALTVAGDAAATGVTLPASVRRVRDEVGSAGSLDPAGITWARVANALRLGEEWMGGQEVSPSGAYPNYYLYALERFHSFREARLNRFDPEPDWYETGVAYLERTQSSPGEWNVGCGAPSDTAFAVLFMLRATQKSLQRGIGEGALVSGRGLPKNLAAATLRRGQVVVEMDAVGVGEFLAMMERKESDRLDALAADPAALVVGKLSEADGEKLRSVLRSGSPDLRLVAARALGRANRLDDVPTLLFALTDPDRRVALAARDGLRAVARRPRGFGMPDDFTDDQRYFELEQWKRWYLTLRPEEIVDVGR